MNLEVSPTETLSGTVDAPASKSYTIRAYVAGLLADGEVPIEKPLRSLDADACLHAITELGADVTDEGDTVVVAGTAGDLTAPKKPIDVANSGTTIRLLTAAASIIDKKITLTGDESIRHRPMAPLLSALGELGVTTASDDGHAPVTVTGPLEGGSTSIPGDISSQYLSALLMACPYAKNTTTITVEGELKSKPYVEMTLDLMRSFRIDCDSFDDREFRVPTRSYHAKPSTVEGDYSSAAFLLAATAMCDGEVTVTNLRADSKQADTRILQVLQAMGALIDVGSDSVTIKGEHDLHGAVFDLGHAPDLVPVTAVLGAVAEGTTIIENVEHARYKECDRIAAMATELAKMEVYVEQHQDGLVIEGTKKLKGTAVSGWRDHRIVMALACVGLRAEGATTISDGEYAAVTYPDFAADMRKLGAAIAGNK